MTDNAGLQEFKQGIELLRNGYASEALEYLQHAAALKQQNPFYLSFLGVCTARAQKKWAPALELCKTAIQIKRDDVQLHLNLAEVYISAGQREDAVETLNNAVRFCGEDQRIDRQRKKLGRRGSPVLPFFERGHFLNRNLGKLRFQMKERLRGTAS